MSCAVGEYFEDDFTEPRCYDIDLADPDFCINDCSPCEVLWSNPGDTTPSPLDCNVFYVSLDGGVLLAQSCSDSTPIYDYTTGLCQTDLAFCYNFCDKCSPYCLQSGNVPDPSDCTAFYRCNPPQVAHFQCPAEENFDRDLETCSTTAPCVLDCE